MTLAEITAAVDAGKVVCWSHEGYRVTRDSIGQLNITCLQNKSCIGLTWQDGVTLNGKEEQFFVKQKEIPELTMIIEQCHEHEHRVVLSVGFKDIVTMPWASTPSTALKEFGRLLERGHADILYAIETEAPVTNEFIHAK